MQLAEVRPGMSIADIGAGQGYYTVRLSPIIGRQGRILAEDIVPETIRALRNTPQDRWDSVKVPEYKAPRPKPETRVTTLADAAKRYLETIKAGKTTLFDCPAV